MLQVFGFVHIQRNTPVLLYPFMNNERPSLQREMNTRYWEDEGRYSQRYLNEIHDGKFVDVNPIVIVFVFRI